MGVMSVREFNANVSRAIALVEAGETIEITKNGRVVAELRPKPARDQAWRNSYDEMVAAMRAGLPLRVDKVTQDDKYGDAPL